jgi:hypothetical protein
MQITTKFLELHKIQNPSFLDPKCYSPITHAYTLQSFARIQVQLWGDFLSLYSQFYEVIILGGTYVIGERKMQSVYVDIKLRLQLKTNNLLPMHHLWFGSDSSTFPNLKTLC